jgi:MFS family permease
LNPKFAGLVSNFPLFSNARFGWGTTANALFFAFVGACAVATQGALIGRLQPRLGEARLVIGGLALVAMGLVLVAVVPSGVLLYPVVGLLALGAGLAIPSVTGVISMRTSERAQGTLMGGIQAVVSLALILGPILAGLAFDLVGVPAPYLLGGLLAALALLVAARSLFRGGEGVA